MSRQTNRSLRFAICVSLGILLAWIDGASLYACLRAAAIASAAYAAWVLFRLLRGRERSGHE
ncbi:MAG TPA: hypothetical protein VLA56_14100 [Pseudomonadales bacterium]|nr:hypothetical protein [Pseudomonadales bacterium]